MKDIAKEVGVSQATVSRVINGNCAVSSQIKMKVMECVRKLNYQPNIIAQSLVGNKSLLIGVIITDISNPFFSEIIKSIEREATTYGYSIILCNTDGSIEKEKKYLNILKSYKVDGILIVPSDIGAKSFNSLKNFEIPIVVITQDILGFSCVSISHYIGGKEVAKHLINMGYSKFVFIGREEEDKAMGFKEQIENSGFDLDKDLIIKNKQYSDVNGDINKFIIDNLHNGGIGIFACNDIEALVILHMLKEMKVKIPQEVALVGFDNTFISKEVNPTLSSVAQSIEEIGRQSVEVLMDKICKKNDIDEKHIILEPRLVVRESSVKSSKVSSIK